MHVDRLVLTDFRSYEDAVIEPGSGLIVITGENGAGKTNMLEAVSLLSPGRGLRGATLREMARSDGPGGFAVAARLDDMEIGTGTTPHAPERRQLRINGAPASANSLGEWLSVLWLTPAMDRLFQEGASGRRRFLDRLTLALEPIHAVHASRYEAAMRARNKLLAQEETPDPGWLTALEARMAEHGSAMGAARRRTVGALSQRLAGMPMGPFARTSLSLQGGDEDLHSELALNRSRDAAAGRTLIGPHRTDLIVTHVEKNQPAERCSTGEQKALLIGIILAHADLVSDENGHRPILLLDEIAAHLDARRREALFERLLDMKLQVWMTGTEPQTFSSISGNATWLSVTHGNISRNPGKP